MGYVYKIENKKNGLIYIGSTVDFDKRVRNHKSQLKRGTHANFQLQSDYNIFGESVFVYEVLNVSPDFREIEGHYLESFDKDKMYNISRNVSGGDILSYHPKREEIVEKISETLKVLHKLPHDVNPWRGVVFKGNLNPNWRGGSSIKYCSCGNTMAFAAKTCIKCMDRKGAKNSFYGKKHSDEVKEILREKGKGRIPTNRKKVSINGVIYSSMKEASLVLGIHLTVVRYRCCLSKNILFKDWFEVK